MQKYLVIIVCFLILSCSINIIVAQPFSSKSEELNISQICRSDIAVSAPYDRFKDNGNGTVSDLKTGLIWKKCPEGLTGNLCNSGQLLSLTWQDALRFRKSLGWRLPNINELASLIEQSCFSPSINIYYFPNTPSNWFWSSSPYANVYRNAWHVNFYNGNVSYASKSAPGHIRFVRDR